MSEPDIQNLIAEVDRLYEEAKSLTLSVQTSHDNQDELYRRTALETARNDLIRMQNDLIKIMRGADKIKLRDVYWDRRLDDVLKEFDEIKSLLFRGLPAK